ncbi:MAG: hypothetical protein ABDI07_01095 [Candidatus Kryptonium sp.]
MKKLFYILTALLILSCEKENQNVIDINFSNPPIIRSSKIEPEVINLDTITVSSEISPEDTLKIKLKAKAIVFDKDGQNDISKTICEIINPYRGIVLTRIDLTRINDSTFYGEPEFKIKKRIRNLPSKNFLN